MVRLFKSKSTTAAVQESIMSTQIQSFFETAIKTGDVDTVKRLLKYHKDSINLDAGKATTAGIREEKFNVDSNKRKKGERARSVSKNRDQTVSSVNGAPVPSERQQQRHIVKKSVAVGDSPIVLRKKQSCKQPPVTHRRSILKQHPSNTAISVVGDDEASIFNDDGDQARYSWSSNSSSSCSEDPILWSSSSEDGSFSSPTSSNEIRKKNVSRMSSMPLLESSNYPSPSLPRNEHSRVSSLQSLSSTRQFNRNRFSGSSYSSNASSDFSPFLTRSRLSRVSSLSSENTFSPITSGRSPKKNNRLSCLSTASSISCGSSSSSSSSSLTRNHKRHSVQFSFNTLFLNHVHENEPELLDRLLFENYYNNNPTSQEQQQRVTILNKLDRKGLSALHWAAVNGHWRTVRVLITHGALADLVDPNGWTALHAAVITGQIECVRELLRCSANVYAVTNSGETVFDMTCDAVVRAVLEQHAESLISESKLIRSTDI